MMLNRLLGSRKGHDEGRDRRNSIHRKVAHEVSESDDAGTSFKYSAVEESIEESSASAVGKGKWRKMTLKEKLAGSKEQKRNLSDDEQDGEEKTECFPLCYFDHLKKVCFIMYQQNVFRGVYVTYNSYPQSAEF